MASGVVMRNGINYAWGGITPIMFGTIPIGFTKITYNETQVKENKYGWGNKPISRGHGNFEYTGEVEMYLDEWKQIISSSPDRNPLNIPPFDITVMFGTSAQNLTKDQLLYVEFTENPLDAKQGDSALIVKIPIIIGDIKR